MLEPFVVEGKALDQVFAEDVGGPDAKARGLVAVDAVPDGDDGIEVVVLDLPSDAPLAFLTNYFHSGNG